MFGTTLDAVRAFAARLRRRRAASSPGCPKDFRSLAVASGRLINVFGSGLVSPSASIHFHLQVGIPLSVVGFIGAVLVLRPVSEVLHSPLITSLASDSGHADERGSRLSLIEIAKRLGMGLGAALGGAFFDFGVANLLWPTLIVGCAGLTVGLLALERRVSPAEHGVAG